MIATDRVSFFRFLLGEERETSWGFLYISSVAVAIRFGQSQLAVLGIRSSIARCHGRW